MRGQIRTDEDRVEIVMTGAISFDRHQEFNDLMDLARHENKTRCVIDLAGITQIDSAGIGMLLLAFDECTKRNEKLSLRRPIDTVRKVLEHCKINMLIPIE